MDDAPGSSGFSNASTRSSSHSAPASRVTVTSAGLTDAVRTAIAGRGWAAPVHIANGFGAPVGMKAIMLSVHMRIIWIHGANIGFDDMLPPPHGPPPLLNGPPPLPAPPPPVEYPPCWCPTLPPPKYP